ncbi:MAG: ComF family protein [Verrucomicrobiota bacterium]|nr:ComF family protein [Verrucomicrobiota bacterium]
MKIGAGIKINFERLIGLVYPRTCVLSHVPLPAENKLWVCDEAIEDRIRIESPYCRRCGLMYAGEILSEFECPNCVKLEFAFEEARAAYIAKGSVRELIHKFKYEQQLWLKNILGLWIEEATHLVEDWGQIDGLIPIPLHPARKRERGFNQSEVLAQTLAEKSGKPILKAINRVKYTNSQVTMNRAERLTNLRKAFALNNKFELRGGYYALIDDVFTTGATAHECSRLLKKAGARKVLVLTVARG